MASCCASCRGRMPGSTYVPRTRASLTRSRIVSGSTWRPASVSPTSSSVLPAGTGHDTAIEVMGDERARKRSERMPDRAIMPRNQVSSDALSEMSRIGARANLRPLRVTTNTRAKCPNVPLPRTAIPTRTAR
jgi:hypothetical protein